MTRGAGSGGLADVTSSRIQLWTALIGASASLAAVFLAGLAIFEFQQDRQTARRQIALESVAQAKAGDVLEALVRLDEQAELAELAYDDIRLDIARVMSWYDYLAGLYLVEGLIDRCIVKSAVSPYAKVLQKVLDGVHYPVERRENFDLLINRMAVERCDVAQ